MPSIRQNLRCGLSWQVVLSALPRMMTQTRGAKLDRVIATVMQMKKFDLQTLECAQAD